ncbi:thiamine biosynthesis protein thio (plasmid) [Salipiger sp. CCB-MM3]|uniref:FAD-dependent oxidoreductase n=1 Tax=Salipiger sp. CCB-MM3 TaxID=1792508 RepID=UPI00080AACAF|nr:FAD-dependent oxidoreductase [Salipiger sp. CCB-MM3]ANT63428.1 thiamine biosynthesis protein thio [Salipiger sp. CCB-MM3]
MDERISVLGGGVAGLCAALALAERGLEVELIVPEGAPPPASKLAGGMLAPFCEGESAPPEITRRGRAALGWWRARTASFRQSGTLVLAPPRDRAELTRFARATTGHALVDPGTLEPELSGRFASGLFFAEEAHLDPGAAMADLRTALNARGVRMHGGAPSGRIVECRGMGARDRLPDLRAVRGEMLELHAPGVRLTRTIRLLHPRFACYIVPRAAGRYMIGATMIESADPGPVTARAVMELLSAAYTVHPGFADAALVTVGAGLRPAFPDNLPALRRTPGRIHLNGMYRHGFLMAPVLAEDLADEIVAQREETHAN